MRGSCGSLQTVLGGKNLHSKRCFRQLIDLFKLIAAFVPSQKKTRDFLSIISGIIAKSSRKMNDIREKLYIADIRKNYIVGEYIGFK